MESVTEKFLRYVKVDTQSDELSETFPSTKKQFNLAGMLVEELKNMGVSDVYFDEKYCYVYAKIPANTEKTNYTGNADRKQVVPPALAAQIGSKVRAARRNADAVIKFHAVFQAPVEHARRVNAAQPAAHIDNADFCHIHFTSLCG